MSRRCLAVLVVATALASAASAMAQQVQAQTSAADGGPAPGASSAAPAPATVPAPGLPLLPAVGKEAFEQVQQNAAPLTPDQIRSLRRLVDDAERAASAYPRATPKPVSTAVTANLAPGAQPPVVRLFDAFVTSVLFIDAIGNPLPIVSADLMKGGFTVFEIEPGTNVLKLSPSTPYAAGNISVSLKGVSAPVVLTLISGQREVDYRVDVRVAGGNVAARLATLGTGTSQTNQTMLEFLSGALPEGARPLVTDNTDVQVWALDNRYFVRTALSLLSPAYINPGKSSDGTSYYEIPPTSVLVVSVAGSLKYVNVEAP